MVGDGLLTRSVVLVLVDVDVVVVLVVVDFAEDLRKI